MTQKYRVLGLMSGTSIDAIDVALIETDGAADVVSLGGEAYPYDKNFRDMVRQCFGKKQGREDPDVAWVEQEITKRHAAAVNSFLRKREIASGDIDMIGFHGQTIWHSPKHKETIQLGDAALLAELTGIRVVYDFRTADVMAGGEGAPLVPLYHQALARDVLKPLAIINIGGVSNMTLIGPEGDSDLLAFDAGPGNALLDDLMLERRGVPYDKDGAFAATGQVDESHIEMFLHHPFFDRPAPKSLDRDVFKNFVPGDTDDANAAATLTMMTVCAIVQGLSYGKTMPRALYLTGGGRHNATIRSWLQARSGVPVGIVEDLGWEGDLLEAQAFAYLAVRSVLGLPLTLPTTTGVPQPLTGGRST